MARYRKKIIELDAVQWVPADFALRPENMPEWFREALADRRVSARDDGRLVVKTMEGDLACKPGSWVVKGIKGELYPVDEALFADLYEPA